MGVAAVLLQNPAQPMDRINYYGAGKTQVGGLDEKQPPPHLQGYVISDHTRFCHASVGLQCLRKGWTCYVRHTIKEYMSVFMAGSGICPDLE